MTPQQRRDRFAAVRLYLVTPLRPGGRDVGDVVAAALRGGVDCVQLRGKEDDDEAILAAADAVRGSCARHGAPLIVNDRPDLALAAGADGVHVGQDDVTVAEARAIVGEGRLVGLSTHGPAELAAARAASGADAPYHVGVGPVHATPTKAGRDPVGLGYVRLAAGQDELPFVAIGGIDASNVADVLAAGAPRVAVVRAVAEADDPERAARGLRDAVDEARG